MKETTPQEDSKRDSKEEQKRSAAVPIFVAITAVIVILMLVSVSMFRAGTSKDQVGQLLGVKSGIDGLLADATSTSVDPLKSEMTLRLALTPEGVLDDGSGLLAYPVTLYYDTLNGTKQVDFKTKMPLGSVDLSIPLLGDSISSYPCDVYNADVDLPFVTSGKALEGTAGSPRSATTTTSGPAAAPPATISTGSGSATEVQTSPTTSEAPAPGTFVPPVGDDSGAGSGVPRPGC